MYTHTAGEDFMEVEMDVFFPPQVASVDVEVPLGLDDIFPGEDKVFEVYLGPSPGVFVSPTAYTNVTIIDPDPPLPGESTCLYIVYIILKYYDIYTIFTPEEDLNIVSTVFN